MAASQTWEDFSDEATMHGVKRFSTRKRKPIHRLAWLLLFLGSIAYFCYAAGLFFTNMRRRTTTTKIKEVKREVLRLPTITICSRNMIKRDSVKNETYGEYLEAIYRDYYGYNGWMDPKRFNWSEPPFNTSYFTSSEGYLKVLDRLSYNVEDMIPDFTINHLGTGVYQRSDLFTTVMTTSGRCIQFNSNGSLTAKQPGMYGGLGITLKMERDDYFYGPLSQADGFMFVLHDPITVPSMIERGLLLEPSTLANVQMKGTRIQREPPYADGGNANCFDRFKELNPLHYYNQYSYTACTSECFASHIIRNCGCRYHLNPPINGTKACSFYAMITCVKRVSDEFYDNQSILLSCDCRDVCDEFKFSAQITTSRYPSKFDITLPENKELIVDDDVEFTKVNFFFGEMSYQSIEETVEYSIHDLISNLGGTLGVCVGASILSLVELCEFVSVWLVRKISPKAKTSINPDRVESVAKDSNVE